MELVHKQDDRFIMHAGLARYHSRCSSSAKQPDSQHRKGVARMTAAKAKALLALDFDGVICDSVGESSLSAWKAARRVFPELMQQSEDRQDEVVEKMRTVRPVVETGAALSCGCKCGCYHRGTRLHCKCAMRACKARSCCNLARAVLPHRVCCMACAKLGVFNAKPRL